jgi:hypothetical protein
MYGEAKLQRVGYNSASTYEGGDIYYLSSAFVSHAALAHLTRMILDSLMREFRAKPLHSNEN